jgi:hypothetical protein
MVDIFDTTGGQVIDADDFISFSQQVVCKMRADETCSPGDDDAHKILLKLVITKQYIY